MRYSLQTICPYLSLILKANTQATFHCSTWLRFHFVDHWSMISSFLFCVVVSFSPRSRSENASCEAATKEGENVLMCFRKVALQRSEGCLHKAFWSRTYVWRIVGMHGCTIYTQSLLILHFSTLTNTHTRTTPQRNSHFLFLFRSRHTRDHMQTRSLTHTHTHTYTHTSSSYVPWWPFLLFIKPMYG